MRDLKSALVVISDNALCQKFLLEAGVIHLLVPTPPWDGACLAFEHGGRLWMGCHFTNPTDPGWVAYGIDLRIIPLAEAHAFFRDVIKTSSLRCAPPLWVPVIPEN